MRASRGDTSAAENDVDEMLVPGEEEEFEDEYGDECWEYLTRELRDIQDDFE